VISLKRFGSGRYREKSGQLVRFPLTGLNLSEHILDTRTANLATTEGGSQTNTGDTQKQESAVYDLYAVTNHFGSLHGGHYTAYAKNPFDQNWYNFDDSSTSEVTSEAEIVSPAAYVLFYQRRGTQRTGISMRNVTLPDDPLFGGGGSKSWIGGALNTLPTESAEMPGVGAGSQPETPQSLKHRLDADQVLGNRFSTARADVAHVSAGDFATEAAPDKAVAANGTAHEMANKTANETDATMGAPRKDPFAEEALRALFEGYSDDRETEDEARHARNSLGDAAMGESMDAPGSDDDAS